jgi:hypothetical protein
MTARLNLLRLFRFRCSLAISFLACIACTPSLHGESFQICYVAVGSSVYLKTMEKDCEGFLDNDGMNKSAKLVAERLRRCGAFFGVTLTSDTNERKAVSLSDIQSTLSEVRNVINTRRPTNPLFVFYFAGHGISEGIAWNHFSVPGNFVHRGTLNQLSLESLAQKTLCAADLVEDLRKWQVPFLVMLDTCYEGSPASVNSSILGEAALKSIASTVAVLRFINQFHDSNPVLFSTVPGTVVRAVADPVESKAALPVGPLGRRVVLVLDDVLKASKQINLKQFVDQLCSVQLDSQTSPAVTHATPTSFWASSLVTTPPSDARFEGHLGTASVPEICDRNVDDAQTEPTITAKSAVKASIEISGPIGEYISEGHTRSFKTPHTKFVIDDSQPGTIIIDIGDLGDSWEVELAAPNGNRFEKTTYKNAERYGFAESGHAGISVSGPGRACNEVSGILTVQDVSFNSNGRLSKLFATVIQHCDKSQTAVKATIAIQAMDGPTGE